MSAADYRPFPLAIIDTLVECTRCWTIVSKWHQEQHDQFHAVALAAANVAKSAR